MNPNSKFGLCAVLAGSLLSTFLSGMCSLQAFLYMKQYPKDPTHLKALAFLVWSMDTVQTCCIVSLSFQYMILHFTDPDVMDHIFITVVVAILLTAILTFVVNGFFAYKVHKLSEGNMWLTVPTVTCMILRLGLALTTIIKMADLQSFRLYGLSYSPLLTVSLSLSALTDLIITGGLCHYLRALNPDLYRTRKMLSTIVSFADNNGALTCVVALSSLICWITIPHKLVYLALHFTIGKCYSNSLLATLNMRNYVKRTAVTPVDIINIMNPICLPPNQRGSYPMPMRARPARVGYDLYDEEEKEETTVSTERAMGALEIKVDRIIQYG